MPTAREPTPPSVRAPALFGGFAAARGSNRRSWAVPLLTGVALIHVGLFAVMWAKSIWELDQLESPRTQMDLAVAPPPPAPPPPPAGSAKVTMPVITPKQPRVVREVVQFTVKDRPDPQESPAGGGGPDVGATEHCDPATEECGTTPDGVRGGIGDVAPPAARPPVPPNVPPPPAPVIVAPQLLDGQRIAGTSRIVPDDVTKTELGRAGKGKLVGSFKLCIGANGAVSSVTPLKSTTYPAYDQKIVAAMKRWTYRPYLVNGTAVPVCTAVTFVYTQT